ncbi:oxidation resistance protein 1b isoform X1 [Ctenopharyngodon idella]|uniref:oxidation resistance protein 1b isoform X1 n=1 Tax=Ctenopharyngodon idella TaxID=7959 RepID=UPI00222EB1A9|nr:oxidation resistance protein 1b isoform X1 [Ctenopharyngodon idella]XP_051727923.1 oxidation resistance protein 1b isoform X1 [Ctenopharyngodon idella]
MFNTKRLKKKSQSVDIPDEGYAGSFVKDLLASPIIQNMTRTAITEEKEINTSNIQKARNPRRGELKRGYTLDTGQKKSALERKDVRRISFQRPKGTMEYVVESRDTLNSIALKFDTTPNELVQLNKLFSRAVVPGKVLYVPDPEYISSADSSPSLSPISPLSPTSSEADLEKATTDSDDVHRRHSTHGLGHGPPRPARVVSSTSEEEEALTEKFLKMNCKYITDGKGIVSGVLLVTPNNVMFDPHKSDRLVQERGCEEYGIMCPLEEVQSAAMCREITDIRVRELVPPDLELEPSVPEVSHLKRTPRLNAGDAAHRIRETGNDSASTAPRSTEASLSEDVFTESELSPVRDDALATSSDELQQIKSSGASSESVQTINQAATTTEEPSMADQKDVKEAVQNEGSGWRDSGIEQSLNTSDLYNEVLSENVLENVIRDQPADEVKSRTTSESLCSDTVAVEDFAKALESQKSTEAQTMQSTSDMKEGEQRMSSDFTPAYELGADEGQSTEEVVSGSEGKQKSKLHKFLCLRVGRAMRKTFVSHASASMLQYAQRDRKHEYWFAVPSERSDHLYAFFVQWTPDVYGEGLGGVTREPGFVVVKKNQDAESGEHDKPVPDITFKDWEVVSVSEYYRRIDALKSEDLRSLCKRLQITTKEEVNSKHVVKSDPDPESFRPSLNEPSDLLQPDQIEKLAKHLPARTIGYPWSLAFSTSKHGMSIKSLYRTMQGQDSPVLMVIKDSDGQLFGALASEPFKVSDGFYGTGETFVFSFCPDLEVFKWTGDNMFFIKGDPDSLAFGGGGGEFGLWLDGDLYHGRTHSCKTFGNPMLSKTEDFYVQDIEIWSFE